MNNKKKLKVGLVILASLTWSLKASAEITVIDVSANNEIEISGKVKGSYLDTHASDDIAQRFKETSSKGTRNDRYSYLEHVWQFEVTEGTSQTLHIEAYGSDKKNEGDDFLISYSTDNLTFTDVLTINSESDAIESSILPSDLNGTVYIRVRDADRTFGNTFPDWLEVNHLFIRTEIDDTPVVDETIDAFGITKVYPTKQGSLEWDATHWDNGVVRDKDDLVSNRDPYDPTNWSQRRGGQSGTSPDWNGAGVMRMEGSSPQLNIDSYVNGTTAEQLYKDVEATVYFKHTVVGTKSWTGLYMGLRANDDPDTSCDDQAYWVRMRQNGQWQFYKELNGKSKYGAYHDVFTPKINLPEDKWLGMKFITTNVDVGDEVHVKLELYLDLTSDGDVSSGGAFEKVGELIDDGSWGGHDLGTCTYSDGHIITEGAGVPILKNSGDLTRGDYKYFSVREVDTGDSGDTGGTGGSGDAGGTETHDTFGIDKFFATESGSIEWVSNWGNGVARSVGSGDRDPEDTTGFTHRRGSATTFDIDGSGILEMGGSQPRIYINPYTGDPKANPDQFYKNVEGTIYYKRTGTDGANWGGLVMGLRSGPEGHGTATGDNCDANTYYARLRHDGKWDFEKELKHSASTSAGYTTLYPDGLPADQWIGMKYLAYNIENDTKVKLELWIDDTSNGDTTNGGEWRLLGEHIDDGNWIDTDVEGCSYAGNKIITEGGGAAFIRNTGAEKAEYKHFSIREIDPNNRLQELPDVPPVVIPPATITDGAAELTAVSVTASSEETDAVTGEVLSPVENVFDNDLSTRWAALGQGEYLTIDLGERYFVTEMHAAWFKGDTRQSHYQVQISDDETTWVTVASGSGSGGTLEFEQINVTYAGRYVRYLGFGNTSNDWNSVNELKVFGMPAQIITDGSAEVSAVSIIASSEEVPNLAVNVFDNDLATRWSALGQGEYLTIDLGAQYLVTEMHAAWLKGNERQSHYQIDISHDGVSWTTVNSGSSSGTSVVLEFIGVNDSGRYIRFIGLGNSSNDWNSVTEIKIFGSTE